MNDRARRVFEGGGTPPGSWIYRLRESRLYVGTWRVVNRWLVPNAFGIAMAAVLFVGLPLRLTYQIASRTGSFCTASVTPVKEALQLADGTSLSAWVLSFYPRDICTKSSLDLHEGKRYAIQIAIPHDEIVNDSGKDAAVEKTSCRARGSEPDQKQRLGGWVDRTYPVTSTTGIKSQSMLMGLFVPFRRIWGADWFVPIAAVGRTIPERYYLTDAVTVVTPTRTGALSFYVNDAAIPVNFDGGPCFGWNCFYRNNVGGPAKIRVVELDALVTANNLPNVSEYTCDEQLARLQTSKRP